MTRLSSHQRRVELVSAATRVINRQGVHAATTRAIVAEADMPLASFHYVFHSRNELIRELIASVVDRERQVALQTVQPGRDIRTTVRAALQAYFDLVAADPPREQAMFELTQYALRTEGFGDLPPAQYESYRRAAGDLLRAGAASAGISWRLPVDEVARLVVTFTDGLTLGWLADRDDAAAGRIMDVAADTLAALAEPEAGRA